MDAWMCMHRYSIHGESDDIHGIVHTCSTSA